MQHFSPIKARMIETLENKGLSRYEFYMKSGITRGVLDKETGISEDNIAKFIAYFPDVNTEWLITGKGEMFRTSASPYPHTEDTLPLSTEKPGAGFSGKGIPLLPIEAFAGIGHNGGYSVQEGDLMENYVVPLFDDAGADFMIPVRGSSMYPKYNSGDVVACRFVKEILFVQWGKVYVLDTTSQGAMVKRLYAGSATGNVLCRSDNKAYPDFEVPLSDINNIALVVGVIRLE